MTETNHAHTDPTDADLADADVPGPDEPQPEVAEPVTTGHPEVDSVLRSLDALDGAPLADHVAVFESAHERLRTVLSDAGRADQG